MLQDMVLESEGIHDFVMGLAQSVADRSSEGGPEILCAVTLLRPRTKATVASSDNRATVMD